MARPMIEQKATTYTQRIGKQIRKLRVKAKLAAREAAAAAGMPTASWYALERGELGQAAIERLPAIAAALKCKPKDLLP